MADPPRPRQFIRRPTAPKAVDARNFGTVMLDRDTASPVRAEPLPLPDVFRHHLDALRAAYLGTPENGCLVAAVDPVRGIAASVRMVAPTDGRPTWLTIGRHDRCGLCLTDPAVSLRHALLVVRRLPSADLRVRLVDLRSGLGLTGEDGRTMESVSVEGHLFVGVGRYVIVVLLGGEDLAISDDGAVVLSTLPPRVFFDARERPGDLSSPANRPVASGNLVFGSGTAAMARARGLTDFHSRVSIHAPVLSLGFSAPVLDGDRLGTLTFRCSAGSANVPVYKAQVRSGLLLGRYERCESADLPLELPDTVSRIHALVLQEGDGLYVMDTASTFGVHWSGQEVAGVRLEGEVDFGLGPDVRLRWQPQARP